MSKKSSFRSMELKRGTDSNYTTFYWSTKEAPHVIVGPGYFDAAWSQFFVRDRIEIDVLTADNNLETIITLVCVEKNDEDQSLRFEAVTDMQWTAPVKTKKVAKVGN